MVRELEGQVRGHARSCTVLDTMDRARRLTREKVQRSRLRLTEERREHLRQQDREAKRVRRQEESDLRRSRRLCSLRQRDNLRRTQETPDRVLTAPCTLAFVEQWHISLMLV